MELKGRIVVYSITGCKHCKAAKSKLETLNLLYHDINVEDHPDQREAMQQRTGKLTVPQIFFNEKHVGGNAELQALTPEELDELIAYVRDNSPPDGAPEPPVTSEGTGDGEDVIEVDEMASLVEDLHQQRGIIHRHREFLIWSHPNTFTGENAITYIAHKKNIDREAAMEIATKLVEKKFVAPIKGGIGMRDDKSLYRLLQDWPTKALNAGIPAYKSITSASELSSLLRRKILKLYNKFLSADGKAVDYAGLGRSQEFEDFVALTAQLQRVELSGLSREETLSFFINIYNALVIHGNIKVGFPASVYQRYKFFNEVRYLVGGLVYSLQDIENGVLRSNRKGVGMLSRPFAKSDPRLATALPHVEPLVHFALVCGARSCPPIKTYSPEAIDSELKLSAAAFLESDDGCRVDAEDSAVGLSMIFKWYREDFGGSPYEVLKWVRNHMSDGGKKQKLTTIIEDKAYHLSYLAYDWGANSQ